MLVYRISKNNYANDITGEGARLHGGRWNHQLTACLYTSGSRALALLEYTVNVNIAHIPRGLSIVTLDIPEDALLQLRVTELPDNWQDTPAPASTKDFGTALLQKASYSVIVVPSVVLPDEFNYLLNPLHPGIAKVKVVSVKDLVYDLRIKLV